MDWINNCPRPDCKNMAFYREFLDIIHDNNLTQIIQEPTRENNILDLFLTTNPSAVLRSNVIPGISDHDIPLIDTNITAPLKPQKPRKIHLYKRADWVGFKKHIEDLHTDMSEKNTFQLASVDQIWNQLSNALSTGVQTFIPTKTASKKNGLPWINRDIKTIIGKRNKAFKKYKKRPNPSKKQTFLELKHLCRRKIKIAHQTYLEDILNTNEDQPGPPNTKKLYSLLKHARQDSFGVGDIKKDGKLIQEDSDKATALNDQFQSVFTSKSPLSLTSMCQMKLDQRPNSVQVGCSAHVGPNIMPDIQITTAGVQKLLAGLNPHKAAGPDDIKPIVLKNLAEELAPLSQKLFNCSLSAGVLPEVWRHANVTPVFKKGPRSDPANYRPISLTCILCKTLEHIVASNIMKHFSKFHLFYDLQHGFRDKRSCQTQLIMLVDDLHRAMNDKKQTDLILLDFSKAFDKVNHEKLIFKLYNYGIRGATLNWIKAFLNNRTQSVVVNGSASSSVPVSSGVPQGSVLGPILFLIYINDLPDNLSSTTRLFADDTAVYLSFTSKQDVLTLQNDLKLLEEWEAKWDMHFNPSKCQVINITNRKTKIPTTYTLHGTTLESVTSAKYLGVTISNDLTWNQHINNVTKKANSTLGFLRRNLKVKSEKIKCTAYKTLVRPQLEYASAVWSPYSDTCISQIEKVQRRAARWIRGDYRRQSSVTDMLSSLDLRRLDLRRVDQRLILFHKIINGLVAVPPDLFLIRNHRPARSGHPQTYRTISAHSDKYKSSFFPSTVIHWNGLSPSYVTMSANQFSGAVDHKYVALGGRALVVGRKDCDILVAGDATVSRKHAELSMSHPEANLPHMSKLPILLLKDMSKFGTFVNNQRVDGETMLKDGDSIKFGSSKLSLMVVYEPLVITSSCLDTAAKKSVKKLLCILGGHMINEWKSDCSLLIMSKISVTIKVICALVTLKPIVTLKYLERYIKYLQGTQDKPDPTMFLPDVAETQLDPNEASFSADERRKTLFQGMTFVFLNEKQFKKMSLAIELAGGMPLLMEEGGDEDALLDAQTVVMNNTESDTNEASQKWTSHVEELLARHGKHMIPDAELGYAVLYCSTEKHCNPEFSQVSERSMSKLPSQSLSQVDMFGGDTETQNRTQPSTSRTQPSTSRTQPSTSRTQPSTSRTRTQLTGSRKQVDTPSSGQTTLSSAVTQETQKPSSHTKSSVTQETMEKTQGDASMAVKEEPISQTSRRTSQKRDRHKLDEEDTPAVFKRVKTEPFTPTKQTGTPNKQTGDPVAKVQVGCTDWDSDDDDINYSDINTDMLPRRSSRKRSPTPPPKSDRKRSPVKSLDLKPEKDKTLNRHRSPSPGPSKRRRTSPQGQKSPSPERSKASPRSKSPSPQPAKKRRESPTATRSPSPGPSRKRRKSPTDTTKSTSKKSDDKHANSRSRSRSPFEERAKTETQLEEYNHGAGSVRNRLKDTNGTRTQKTEVIDTEYEQSEVIDQVDCKKDVKLPAGFLTTRKPIKEQVSSHHVNETDEEALDGGAVVDVVSLVARRPQRELNPRSDMAGCPEGYTRWNGKLVRNFKKFKKSQHAGSQRLPRIIGGSDLEVYEAQRSKEMDAWFRETAQAESQQNEEDRRVQDLFDYDPSKRKRSR